ncbi:Spo0B domain-containing protein [Clostridium gasigenes]|uniref:ATP-binding protein n=1 Tax=Clostridium gasigenes TaxID=94869 RepID=UPI0014383EDF|nr:ATP-binding protein [Clostridium gasigenes]NKF06649.1 GHKL domain-containing protein [Clostridium gasigenes]QSW21001.1 Spo0B domain-containing protein [Clostridium gasigenes]
MENINKLKIEMFKIYIILAAFIFSVGIVVSLYLSRNIKISLLGHEPYKFTKMYMQRKEVVDSLEEGIIAVDENGKIIIFNKAAINMLDIRKTKNIEGKFINDIFSKSKLVNIIQSGESRNNEEIIIKDIIIISNGIPIIENNKVIGAVTILRNKTEVTRLAEELTGVNQIIDSLRSNTHEFMNKLHVILGLIQIGKTEDAKSYIMNIREEQSEIVSLIIKKIKDPTIAALIIGKISRAKEMGIKLNLNPNSYFNMNDNLISRNSLVTIIGNLIENSIDSINEKDNDLKNISLLIYNDENSLLITIDDTGNGISSENLKRIYDKGFSTKGKNRGVGMYIIKNILDNYGGEIVIESEEGIGTCTEIRISKVL